MNVCDLEGGRLHSGDAKNIWVKKNHHTREATEDYNVRTLLK